MNHGMRFVTLYRRQESDHPKEKDTKNSKIVVGRGLTSNCEKESERQRRKGKIYPFECRLAKNSKER